MFHEIQDGCRGNIHRSYGVTGLLTCVEVFHPTKPNGLHTWKNKIREYVA